MAILIVLVIFWTPYLLARLLLARHARRPSPAHRQRAYAQAPSWAQTDTGSPDGLAWSALDDRQLTRLLTDSAPRTITD